MLLFEISNGQLLSDFEQCTTNDTNALKIGDICVPSSFSSTMGCWKNPNFASLNIIIENLQVIEIESYAISLSMDILVLWHEHRLLLNVSPFQTAFIKQEDQGKIWSPNFVIANNKMLENKEREQFGFMKDSDPGTLPAIIGI